MIRYTYVIGDIHGNFKALQDVLDKIKYDTKQDRLICVGAGFKGKLTAYRLEDGEIFQSDLASNYYTFNPRA